MTHEKKIEKETNLGVSLVAAFIIICIMMIGGWAFTKIAQKAIAKGKSIESYLG